MSDLLVGAFCALAVFALALQWQITLSRREIKAIEKAVLRTPERLGEPNASPVPEDRPLRNLPTPHPPQSPRLVSPTRAKLEMERKFTQKANAAKILRRAAEEQAR